nr:hypothetical protein [Tanacetum cinerariifolium]
MGEGSAQPTGTQHIPTFDMPPPKPKETKKPKKSKRKITKLPQPNESTNIAANEAVHKEGVTVWIDTFVDFRTKLVEESSKKAKAEITREDDGDDVTIDATPLSSKSPTNVDYKIYKEEKKNYF